MNKKYLIAGALVLILAIGGVWYWQSGLLEKDSILAPAPIAAPAPTSTPIPAPLPPTEGTKSVLDSLKNAEYYFPIFDETIRLKNGKYSSSGITAEIYEDSIGVGDLDNDGEEEAAVVTVINGGGSGYFHELAIMKKQKGSYIYLAGSELEDRVRINSVIIESGIVVLDMVVHGPYDGACCPTVEKILRYKLSNNQLIEVK